jgi:hypothetical protein
MSTQGDVDRAQRELEQLHKKQADEARKEAGLSEKIARARASIGRTSSASTVKSKIADIARHERDLVSVQKKKAHIAKQIGATMSKLGKSQQRMAEEQTRNQKWLLDDLRRQQAEFRSVQKQHIRKTVDLVDRERPRSQTEWRSTPPRTPSTNWSCSSRRFSANELASIYVSLVPRPAMQRVAPATLAVARVTFFTPQHCQLFRLSIGLD